MPATSRPPLSPRQSGHHQPPATFATAPAAASRHSPGNGLCGHRSTLQSPAGHAQRDDVDQPRHASPLSPTRANHAITRSPATRLTTDGIMLGFAASHHWLPPFHHTSPPTYRFTPPHHSTPRHAGRFASLAVVKCSACFRQHHFAIRQPPGSPPLRQPRQSIDHATAVDRHHVMITRFMMLSLRHRSG